MLNKIHQGPDPGYKTRKTRMETFLSSRYVFEFKDAEEPPLIVPGHHAEQRVLEESAG